MTDPGLLPPTAQAAPAPSMGAAPAPSMGAAPAPSMGAAPVMPNQAPAPADPMAADPMAADPMAPAGPARGMSVPQPQRDYQANPLNEKDQQDLINFQIMATKVIHNPEIRTKLIERIKGIEHPYADIVEASLVVMQRVEQEGIKNKRPWDNAVKLIGGMNIVEQVIEVAQASGKIAAEIPSQDYQVIQGQAVQKYYQKKIATGEISKEQAAEDAHMLAKYQAQMQGEDTSEITQRLGATAKLQQQGVNAPENAALPDGQLKAPVPAADPMHPKTTMKEMLATGQGGLLNG